MFTALKDRATGALAKRFLNARLERYGKIIALRLDSSRTTGHLVCVLEGEEQPVQIDVQQYTVRKESGKTLVRIDRITCDRTWVHRLLNDFARERWFELPGWASAGF